MQYKSLDDSETTQTEPLGKKLISGHGVGALLTAILQKHNKHRITTRKAYETPSPQHILVPLFECVLHSFIPQQFSTR